MNNQIGDPGPTDTSSACNQEHEPSTCAINRKVMKLPPFSRINANLWFAQEESHFNTAGITWDETKFHLVVDSVDNELLQQVSDN